MSEGFSLCEFNKQKAIRYHHDYGDFDFLLIQADDGSTDIGFYCSVKLSQYAKETIGFAAIRHLEKTAGALSYSINGSKPNFHDALSILAKAQQFLEKHGSTPKPTNQ